MFVLRLLYDLLVATPGRIRDSILEGVLDEIDKERLLTEDAIKEKLKELQVSLEEGEITEEEYESLEEALMVRLRFVKKSQEEV